MDDHDHLLPETSCPFCEHVLDAATSVQGKTDGPKAGDFSLCISCGEWLVFTEDQRVRKPTDDEYLTVAGDRKMGTVRDAWMKMKGWVQ